MAVCKVVIAGAGIAGIEALLRLRRLAGDRVQVTVLSPSDEFVYRPLAVLEPFSRGSLIRYRLERLITPTGARHVRDRLVRVDPEFGLVLTRSGHELPYDALLVALGAGQSNPYPNAALFTDRDRGETFTSIVSELESGRANSLAFVVPEGSVWPLPLYELALLTAHHARRSAIPVQLNFVTAEPRPLKAFGQAAHDAIKRLFDKADIALRTDVAADVPGPGRLQLDDDDDELHPDRIVTLPRVIGPAVPGLPAGIARFTPIDDYCCVPGTEGRVFAAGDATDSPFKHGGLGAQQADTAAAGIAHLAGAAASPGPLLPVIHSTLLTGDKPLYLVARARRGLGWSSIVHEHPPWPLDHKVVAEELGPYLADMPPDLLAD
jgi:sulfide:quinone oxidoreductase